MSESSNASVPELPADRLAARREHLMSEITPRTRPHPRRRRWWLLGGGLAGLAALGGGIATAQGRAIVRQDNGVVAIDPSALRPVYHGHYVTQAQIARLNKEGKATSSANNEELACQGITLYFDTDAEFAAYLADYDARHPMTAATTPAPTGDPCAGYTDSPRYVTGSGSVR